MKNSLLALGDGSGLVELVVRIKKGFLDPNALDLLVNRYHFDVDRLPGSLLTISNALVFGLEEMTDDIGAFRAQMEQDLSGSDSPEMKRVLRDFEPVRPTLYRNGFSYVLLLPKKIANGLVITSWSLKV